MQLVGAVHVAVARDLGDDRRRRDRGARRVAADDRALLVPEVRHREAVDEADAARAARRARSASRSAARFVRCSPRASIPRTQRETTATRAAVRITIGSSSSRASRVVLLGVVERAERAHLAHADALEVEQHGGRDERPGEAAAPGLVGAGDEARADRAVEVARAAGRSTPRGLRRRARAALAGPRRSRRRSAAAPAGR